MKGGLTEDQRPNSGDALRGLLPRGGQWLHFLLGGGEHRDQALFLTDPGKEHISSGLISPGGDWDCVAWSGNGGSWQSNGWDFSLSLGFNPWAGN